MCEKKIATNSRRQFLINSALGAAGAWVFGLSFPHLANAQNTARRRPFVLYVHMGAWEGYSAGLMMPTDANLYPKGVFFANQQREHPNPNVNRHTKINNLVLNDYTKVLESCAGNMLFAVANPQSLAHEEAHRIQQTGSRVEGSGKSPIWAAGFAEATSGTSKASYVLLDGDNRGTEALAKTTPSVTTVRANSITAAKSAYSDSDKIPKSTTAPEADAYANLGKNAYSANYSLSLMTASEKQGAAAAIDALRRGIPDVDAVKSAVEASITRAAIDAKLANTPDKAAVMRVNDNGDLLDATDANRGMKGLLDKLQMAAMLIETQVASGLHINLSVHDYHGGDAHVKSARAGSQVWAQLATFWDWVVSKGYQNDVLVIVANEFNRTPANNSSTTINGVIIADPNNSSATQTVNVVSPGTDHHLTSGFAFFHGSLNGSRIGGIGDSFVPTGGGLNQGPQIGTAPFTSLQLVVSVFMRCFPHIFSDYRAAREIWQPLKETDIIKEILR